MNANQNNKILPLHLNLFVLNTPLLSRLKTSSFLMFFRGRETVHWEQIG